MKITIVSQPFDNIIPPVQGGSLALWAYYVAQSLVTRGNEVTIVSNNGRRLSTQVLDYEGIRYARTPTLIDAQVNRLGRRLSGDDYLYAGWHHAFYGIWASQVAASQNADVIHVMNYSQFVPSIRRLNPNATIALHMHCEWLTQFPPEVIEPRLRQVDRVIGVSPHITGLVADRYPQHADKCVTVTNASAVPDEKPSNHEGRRVLFVGRLSPEKGVHDLIVAFREVLEKVPDASLHLVGDHGSAPLEYLVGISSDPHVQALRKFYDLDYFEHLKQLAGPELGQRIIFEGRANHDAIDDHYRRASVLVNPSLSESFGITVVEAMMMGLPVIATRVGGMKHTVTPETGILVPPASPSALADSIARVLTDPDLASRLGEAGKTRAHRHFTWKQTVEQLLAAYRPNEEFGEPRIKNAPAS